MYLKVVVASLEGHLQCESCRLAKTSAKVVVSRGNTTARLMVIGEAPGAKEDDIGEPFVGRSGSLLDQLLSSVGIDSNEDVFICNVVKCRPPNNRRPTKQELASSIPWLNQQINLVDPWIILLAGTTAVQAILGLKDGISSLRGSWKKWNGRLVMPLFHPSYLLRNPSKAQGAPFSLTVSDLIKVKNMLKTFENDASISLFSSERSCNS